MGEQVWEGNGDRDACVFLCVLVWHSHAEDVKFRNGRKLSTQGRMSMCHVSKICFRIYFGNRNSHLTSTKILTKCNILPLFILISVSLSLCICTLYWRAVILRSYNLSWTSSERDGSRYAARCYRSRSASRSPFASDRYQCRRSDHRRL